MAGVLPDVHLLERGEQGGQHRLLAGAEAPPTPRPQLSGQERSPTTLMGVWVLGRLAAAPGASR